ncbi:YebC/PmpR family DNA-binding transcriptional regulator [Proteocatella sphenisci]|uniref:YebC/PmpR family DNA-binding transcriptional regulator n=1 Tax=Proteocatella sphenisci TaxID=181070 RepID=UPI00048B0690|nr:YebC/PmpR family DNA-binding transcriptional regulator [Proteocatella sphenisci]
MGRIGNIENRKNKQDAKRAKVFTKYARSITVAAKEGGGDPEYNASLKTAVEKAKSMNMPNDNIDRAIKKGVGGSDSENYEHITYEGYGPGGVAVIVNSLTDNKNRTAGNVRFYFDKSGGNMGTAGCVSFMFDKKGIILIEKNDSVEEDILMEIALEAGAEDFIVEDEGFEIITEYTAFDEVKATLESSGYELLSAEVTMLPQTYTKIDESLEKSMEKLIDMLEDDDDVQDIYTNLEA